MPTRSLDDLSTSRYILLRSFRRDGRPVDTPMWFALDEGALLLRTGVGPKTKRLDRHPDVELTLCNYKGRVRPDATPRKGRATILSGADAERADRLLHARYGWQYNTIPLIRIPGVTQGHRELSFREKLRRARSRQVWPDSALVRVDPT
jgi:PPOX class probable F420-dependent enzyme